MGNFMNAVADTTNSALKILDENAPLIQTTLGVIGFFAAAAVIAKNTPKAQKAVEKAKEELQEAEEAHEEEPEIFDDKALKKEKAAIYCDAGKDILAAYGVGLALLCTATYCVFHAQNTNSARIAGLATAYQIERTAREELQDKTIEMLGEKKFNKIRDEINKDKVKYTNPKETDILVPDGGEMLCYDSLTGRYFKSNPNKLHRAENKLNKLLMDEMYVSLNEFYYELGLEGVQLGDMLGWNVDDQVDLYLTSTLTENETPCLVVDYCVAPRYDFRTLM